LILFLNIFKKVNAHGDDGTYPGTRWNRELFNHHNNNTTFLFSIELQIKKLVQFDIQMTSLNEDI
jgi:hypothetical protein